MSNSLNQTLFNKYSDILQRLQIFQVGEYPCVEIHNVVVKKRPVKKLKRKIQNVATRPIFKNQTKRYFTSIQTSYSQYKFVRLENTPAWRSTMLLELRSL